MSTTTRRTTTVRPLDADGGDDFIARSGLTSVSAMRFVVDMSEFEDDDFTSQSFVFQPGVYFTDNRVEVGARFVDGASRRFISISTMEVDPADDRTTVTTHLSVEDAIALRDELNNAIADAERGA